MAKQEQLEFKFYENMKAEEKARIKKESRINMIVEGGIAVGVIGALMATAYIHSHPEYIEAAKQYISNPF